MKTLNEMRERAEKARSLSTSLGVRRFAADNLKLISALEKCREQRTAESKLLRWDWKLVDDSHDARLEKILEGK